MDEGPEIWRALGIGKTRDERVIRIAYARRLAALDIDTGASVFVGLRDHYESALAWSRGLKLVGSWQDGAGETAQTDWPRERARDGAWFAFDLPDRAEWLPADLPPEVAELDLLFATAASENRRWLTAAEKIELRRCWAAIAEDANQHSERAVRWLICNWGPLAVGLVPFAVEHFHWDHVDDATAADGTLGEVLWRYRGVQFLQRARRPGNPYHPAWIELTSAAAPGAGRGRVSPQLVHELQAVARHVWPETEAEFDPHRVAVWKNNTADPAHADNPRQESQFLKTLGKIVVALIIFRIGYWIVVGLLATLGFIVSGP